MAKVKYTKELMEEAVKDAYSIAQVCRNIGLRDCGGNYKTVKKKLEEFNVDTSHFTGQSWNKGKSLVEETCIVPLEEILKENTNYKSHYLKKRLINVKLKEEKCELCGYKENLELHHINGNHYDNRLENLQILCPNCHAKTDNFRNRNSKKQEAPEALSKKFVKNHYCTCMNCGNEFYSDRTDRIRKFCCRQCYNKYLKKLQTGEATEKIQEETKPDVISKLTKENLLKEIPNHNNMTSLGKVFNVSQTTIRNYLEKYDLYESFKDKYDFHAKKVGQYDINTMELIKIYPSLTDAAECTNSDSANISAVCLRKRRSAGGYFWKYIKD